MDVKSEPNKITSVGRNREKKLLCSRTDNQRVALRNAECTKSRPLCQSQAKMAKGMERGSQNHPQDVTEPQDVQDGRHEAPETPNLTRPPREPLRDSYRRRTINPSGADEDNPVETDAELEERIRELKRQRHKRQDASLLE